MPHMSHSDPAAPAEAHLLAPVAALDYFDVRSITLPRDITALAAWNLITAQPQGLLNLAFRIRDTISSAFGVKTIGGFSGVSRDNVQVGDHLDFFLVEHITDDVLVLTERDQHLDVMTCLSVDNRTLSVTSSVVTHNLFGKAYMLPVGPAHKLIVGTMLRRLQRQVTASGPLSPHHAPPA